MTYKQAPEPIALSPSEAADLMGIDLSTWYRNVYPLVRSGTIKAGKIGRCLRIDRASYLNWWSQQQACYTTHAAIDDYE